MALIYKCEGQLTALGDIYDDLLERLQHKKVTRTDISNKVDLAFDALIQKLATNFSTSRDNHYESTIRFPISDLVTPPPENIYLSYEIRTCPETPNNWLQLGGGITCPTAPVDRWVALTNCQAK